MARSLKFGNVVLCEFVAKGENNKFVLVNTFSGDVIVTAFPATLNFGLFAERRPNEVGNQSVSLDFLLNGKPFAELRVDAEVKDLESPICIVLPTFQFTVKEETLFEVFAKGVGFSRTKVLSKQIYTANRS